VPATGTPGKGVGFGCSKGNVLNRVVGNLLEVVEDWREFPARLRGGSLTIGNYDGVHRGHQALLDCLCRGAKSLRGPSIVFTFDPHPLKVLAPQRAPLPLTTIKQRAARLARSGVDVMVVCRVDAALLNLDYQRFFRQIIVGHLAPKQLVEGPNFFFGKNRMGNVERLQELCRQEQVKLQIVAPQTHAGDMISSSQIRGWLREGNVQQANEALGYAYRLQGLVVTGDGRGRQLGFPTANLAEIRTLLPRDGVYAAWTRIQGRVYATAVHVGPPLTFADDAVRVEAHVVGLAADLYGSRLTFHLEKRLRDTRRFDSPQQLRGQIEEDVRAVEDWASRSFHRLGSESTQPNASWTEVFDADPNQPPNKESLA